MRSLSDEDHREVVLDDDEGRVELLLHALDQRTERFRLALGDTGGGLVEADHAGRDREHRGKLDDAPGAGRELGDEAVGVAAEAEEVDELGGLCALLPLDTHRRREPAACCPRTTSCGAPRGRAARVSRTVSSGKSLAAWNVRPEPGPRPAMRGE